MMTVEQSKAPKGNKDEFCGLLRLSILAENKIPTGHPFTDYNSEKIWPTFANHIQEI